MKGFFFSGGLCRHAAILVVPLRPRLLSGCAFVFVGAAKKKGTAVIDEQMPAMTVISDDNGRITGSNDTHSLYR